MRPKQMVQVFLVLTLIFINVSSIKAQSVTGTGTTNFLPKWTNGGTSVIGDCQIYDNGTLIGVNTTSPLSLVTVQNGSSIGISTVTGLITSGLGATITSADIGLVVTSSSSNEGSIGSIISASQDGADVVNIGSVTTVNGDDGFINIGSLIYATGENLEIGNVGTLARIEGGGSNQGGWFTAAGGISNVGLRGSSEGANGIGVAGSAENLSQETYDQLHAVQGTIRAVHGTITDAYSLWANMTIDDGDGTITNGYGVFINQVLGTNKFGIHQQQSDVINYLDGDLGCGTDAPTQQLDVNGNARIRSVGSASSSNVPLYITSDGTLSTSSSDRRLKNNIQPVNYSVADVIKLNPVRFNWNDTKANESDIGFIAQEVAAIFPEAAFTNKTDGYMGVNYPKLTVVLVQAIKEQQTNIESLKNDVQAQQENFSNELENLKKQLAEMNNTMNNLCDNGCEGLRGNIPSAPGNDAVLYQSVPNPTSGSAVIGYEINIPFSSAVISVATMDGRVWKEYQITNQGKGSVQFDNNERSDNSYKYSLIIDGKVFGTKSLVITRH